MILLKNKDKKANIKIGNNIEIKDGSDFPFDLTLYGRSTQETTQGKQLFNYEDTTMVTDGITVDEDGWITATFDNTNGTGYKYLNFYTNNLNLKNSTTYAIVSEIKSVSGTGFLIPVSKTNTTPQTGGQFNSEVSYNFATLTNNMIKIETPTTIDDFSTTNYGLRTLLQFAKGQSGSITFRLSVLEDTSVTADTFVYEKFTGGQPSPSPDYPSPIESVGRKNLFDVTLDGSITNEIQYKTYMLKPNTKYTISTNTYLSNDVIANIFIDLGKSLTPITSTNGVNGSKTITTDSTGYVTIGYRNYSMQLDYSTGMYYCQLEKGTVASDYVPYDHTEISATVIGKNLARVDDTNISATGYTLTTSKGLITLTTTGTGNSFDLVSGTRTGTYLPNYANANDYHLTPANQGIYKLSMPNTTANITGTANQLVAIYTNQRLIQSYITPTGSLLETTSFTLQENEYVKSIYLWSNNLTTITKLQFNLQLEQSPIASSYEEYKSNTLAINLQGNELCSLPNGTKDEVNITNGEALLTKRIGKVVLDGSESWRKAQIGTTGKYYFTFTPSWGQQTTNGKLLYCDYFVPSNTWSEQVVGMWLDTNMIVKTQGSLDNTEDLTSFKTWLSTHNVEVLYELAEPETINLGTVEMPHTYNGVSNITNSADTEMVVKYYKKFEFDKILRSGYNIDEQEYEIAKKQMANGKRKKILSSYVDCIIKIDLGLLDNKTYQEYKGQLEDGEYEYWSYKYNQYKKANFILTKPSITTEYAYDDDIGIDDMEITLEKSSDVS